MNTVFHITSWLSIRGGGIPPVICALQHEQRAQGWGAQVAGLADPSGASPVFPTDCPVLSGRIVGPSAFGYSAELRSRLLASSSSPTIFHVHGLWMYPGMLARQLASRSGAKRIISPHGMLDPWALENSRWKKRLAAGMFENRNLNSADCLHALCQSEADSIRAYGLKNPIAIIPNGVDIPEIVDHRSEIEDQRKMLLFLGRLHPKKGLVNALRAWHAHLQSTIHNRNEVEMAGGDPRSSEWTFVIAGWDQGGHEAELKRLCTELGLAYVDIPAAEFVNGSSTLLTDHCSLGTLPSVLFLGPAFGQEKDLLLRSASAFILPSFSEGLPMSVLEAWSYRLPVLMTDHCNLPEGFAHNAAIRIGTDVESIAVGLHQLLQSTIPDLQSIGLNGRALVERQFTWLQVAAQMKEVYEWMLGGGAKPGCVRD